MSEFIFEQKTLYYEVYGKGRPLVILNGLLMSTTNWRYAKNVLSKNHKVIIIDMLDQGRSSRMPSNYSHTLQVEAINQLLISLDIISFYMLGVSYGGNIAIEYATTYPDRVIGLILSNTAAVYTEAYDMLNLIFSKTAKTGNGLECYDTLMPLLYSKDFLVNSFYIKKHYRALVTYLSNRAMSSALARLTRSAVDYNQLANLKSISCPVLVIGCDKDILVPVNKQQDICDRLPDAKLVVVENCGHSVIQEKPAEFLNIISRWLMGI
ncbi:MAG: alpha/beta hydrolase [Clostridia bacterium]|nr:alpha/beta hydrolase [Clostridia bacterium]